jgi:hypothetical protein
MKTKKFLLTFIVMLFIFTNSAFARVTQSIKLPANQLPFDALPYRSLTNTTELESQIDVDNMGPTGTTDPHNGDALYKYAFYIYITYSTNPGFANKLTIPSGGSLTINFTGSLTCDDSEYDGSGSGYYVIPGGENYDQTDATPFTSGDNLQITYSSITLSPSSYNGYSIVADYTPNYLSNEM